MKSKTSELKMGGVSSARRPFINDDVSRVIKTKTTGAFPGGAVVKTPPANAGDTGSSSGPGRFHVPRSNQARAPQLLSLRSRACEPQLLKPACLEPVFHNKRSHRNEKSVHCNKE